MEPALKTVAKTSRECAICAETKDVTCFPGRPLTRSCSHVQATCLPCLAHSISFDMEKKQWKEIGCPQCGALLEPDIVSRFADKAIRKKYEDLCARQCVQENDEFIWVCI